MVKILIILLTVLIMYRRASYYGYLIDDIEVATHKKRDNWLFDLWGQIRGHSYFNPRIEHSLTTLIHAVNCILVYLAFGSTNISFLAAMLFAVNPVNTQASVWLSGKVYAIGAMCILLGVWIKPLFPVMYFLGYYFSMNVLVTPLLFIFLQPIYYAVLLPILVLSFKKRVVFEPKRRYDESTPWMREVSLRKLIISVKTLGYYFTHCLFPVKLGMCHEYLHVFGLSKPETEKWYTFDKYFWMGVGILVLNVVLFAIKAPALGLFWFTLLMLQWCNFVILNHPICERYQYLASTGLMFGVATLLLNIPYGLYVAVALFTYYAVKLWNHLPAYETNLSFFKSNRENFPNICIPYNQEGLELIRWGRAGNALDTFMEGLTYRPNDFRINYNAAQLLMNMGRFQESVSFLKKAEANLDKNNSYEVWFNSIKNMKAALNTRGVMI